MLNDQLKICLHLYRDQVVMWPQNQDKCPGSATGVETRDTGNQNVCNISKHRVQEWTRRKNCIHQLTEFELLYNQ